MQETRNIITDEMRRNVFSGANLEDIRAQMDADVRPNEEVTQHGTSRLVASFFPQ